MFRTRKLHFERQPVAKHIIGLVIVALLLYFPLLGLQEYRASDEAIYAQIAADMAENGTYLFPTLQGRPVAAFPMYPWLVALFSGFGYPTPLTTRLPGTVALGILAIICGLFARKYKGNLAGMSCAAVILTNYAALKSGMIAQTEILLGVFLTVAWLTWYEFGRLHDRWHLAWTTAFVFVFLGILTAGISAAFTFYLPLLFLRHPTRQFRHLQSMPHFLSFIVFFGAVFLWLHFICDQPLLPWNEITAGNPGEKIGFWYHFVSFPVKCLLYLMPWGVLFWAPFCLALRQFEPPGTVCGYLRTILVCHFVIAWLLPGRTPLTMLPFLGIMAILIGIHFEIVANRYQHFFSSVTKFLGWTGMVALAGGAGFWGLVAWGKIVIEQVEDTCLMSVNAFALLAVAVLIAALAMIWTQVVYRSSDGRVAMTLVWSAFGLRLAYLWICLPILFYSGESRRFVGLTLGGHTVEAEEYEGGRIDPVEVAGGSLFVAVNTANIVSLAHIGYPVTVIERPVEELPREQDIVYFVNRGIPAVPERSWTRVSPFVETERNRQLKIEITGSGKSAVARIFRMDSLLEEGEHYDEIAAVYRGVLKNGENHSLPDLNGQK